MKHVVLILSILLAAPALACEGESRAWLTGDDSRLTILERRCPSDTLAAGDGSTYVIDARQATGRTTARFFGDDETVTVVNRGGDFWHYGPDCPVGMTQGQVVNDDPRTRLYLGRCY